ncbi:Cof-type HAD-IIB family hydrolase [uncultured Limosilactobacillus sp.]|uniref:Cof-type HAD-IIB family hydrolase n=1 Tax=uncultured Limosilactobacillus sp. TaxID=2837629 RepID=UPI0025E1E52F|nr:Cof-type HAD-IIB family hydrolase [uncultured Limosilactobacillus sp.]
MNPQSYQVVAFDMDGTFLNDNKQYNHPLFKHILQTFQAQKRHLVVASGDPLECLRRFFPDEQDQLTIIAENGAQIFANGQEILTKTLDPALAHKVINYLVHTMQIEPVISGHLQGYFPKNASQSTIDHLAFYYPNYQLVDNFNQLPNDQFFQISFLVDDDQIEAAVQELTSQFGNQLVITPSGNGSMDLTIPGINKGWALKQLLDRWHLSSNELAAFGDGGNDVSMLKLAARSFAMPNGGQAVHAVATTEAVADNNHDGVLQTIQQYLL